MKKQAYKGQAVHGTNKTTEDISTVGVFKNSFFQQINAFEIGNFG
jgi:hypothetical protein